MAQTIPDHLAVLPEMVTPESLAAKLGIKTQSIYQRIWRQNKNQDLDLLPPIVHVPGCNRVFFTRQSVIDWWLRAQQPPVIQLIQYERAGRPTIAQQLAKAGG